jgi:hypothetical protein
MAGGESIQYLNALRDAGPDEIAESAPVLEYALNACVNKLA